MRRCEEATTGTPGPGASLPDSMPLLPIRSPSCSMCTKTGLHDMAELCALPRRYTEALELDPEKGSLHRLYANRSLAYLKALRASEALRDADLALSHAPLWPKAHWRRAAALRELGRAPEAVAAFRSAWRLDKGAFLSQVFRPALRLSHACMHAHAAPGAA